MKNVKLAYETEAQNKLSFDWKPSKNLEKQIRYINNIHVI